MSPGQVGCRRPRRARAPGGSSSRRGPRINTRRPRTGSRRRDREPPPPRPSRPPPPRRRAGKPAPESPGSPAGLVGVQPRGPVPRPGRPHRPDGPGHREQQPDEEPGSCPAWPAPTAQARGRLRRSFRENHHDIPIGGNTPGSSSWLTRFHASHGKSARASAQHHRQHDQHDGCMSGPRRGPHPVARHETHGRRRVETPTQPIMPRYLDRGRRDPARRNQAEPDQRARGISAPAARRPARRC